MSTLNSYKIFYHYELGAYGGNPHALGVCADRVAAAPLPDFTTRPDVAAIAAVLASNVRAVPAGYVIVFDNIVNEGSVFV